MTRRYAVVDLETTLYDPDHKEGKSLRKDGDSRPMHKENKIVLVGVKEVLLDNMDGEIKVFSESFVDAGFPAIIGYLNQFTDLIFHNAKFDLAWLEEYSMDTEQFTIHDTMIREYLEHNGTNVLLSMGEVYDRYYPNEGQGKSDILKTYLDKGINVNEIPEKELIPYLKQDLIVTEKIWKKQQKLLSSEALTPLYKNNIKFMHVLREMETAAMAVDVDALRHLEQDTTIELNQLEVRAYEIAREYLGDTEINLKSSKQFSELLFSRRLIDSKKWIKIFQISSEEKKNVKDSRLKRVSIQDFVAAVNKCTKTTYKTKAEQCSNCKGSGKVNKYKVNGEMWKKLPKCPHCISGMVYKETNEIAGFKLPLNKSFVTANGFGTDADVLNHMITKTRDLKVKEFLRIYVRMNALKTYLKTFIRGIESRVRGIKTREDNVQVGFVRTNFRQTLTATGRLSSNKPNFQNLPKGKTFPIKKVFISRYLNGAIIEADFAQLEFRVAAALSGDKRAISDIINGVDIHKESARAKGFGESEEARDKAKAHTFAPLFGASEDWGLLTRYPDIAKWHVGLLNSAVREKKIILPSGRILHFPDAKRSANGYVVGSTNIKNYPVQAFATGDIVPLFCIELHEEFKRHNTYAQLINTVHDSMVIDCPEHEIDLVIAILRKVESTFTEVIKREYNFDMPLPLKIDIGIGKNWLEKVKV